MRGVKGSRKPEWATCHPHRKNKALGLCCSCYKKSQRGKPSTCHPDKRANGLGLCGNCYLKALKRMNPQVAENQRQNTKRWYHTNGKRPDRVARNKARMKLYTLRKNYGFSPDEYLAFLAARNNACEICKTTAGIVIDHDHGSNTVRGALCRDCNLMLGNAKDDADRLTTAAEYLRRHKKGQAA